MSDKGFEAIVKAINRMPEKTRPKVIQAFALTNAAIEGIAFVDINVLENRKIPKKETKVKN